MNLHHSIFKISVTNELEDILTFRDEWNRLLKTIPFYLPTMTFEWQSAWLRANSSLADHLHFMMIRDRDNTLCAIIPLFKTRSQLFFSELDVYTFSGCRDQIKTAIICKPEHQLSVIHEILHYFYEQRRDWDLLTLRRLSTRKADDVFLERILQKHRYPYSIESVLRIPFVVLEDDWESYWNSRKKHFRHEIKRKTKKLSQLGNIEYEIFESPIAGERLENFLKLENSGWKGKNRSSLLHRPGLMRLYSILSGTQSDYLKLLMFNLNLNQKTISSSLCLRTPHGLYVSKIAYDESFNKFSPGILLRLHEIKYCFEGNLKIYDFSGKEQRWMKSFTNRGHYVMDYIIYRKTAASLIRYLGFTKLRPLIKHSHITERFLKNLIDE